MEHPVNVEDCRMGVVQTWDEITTWLRAHAPVTASLLLAAREHDLGGLPSEAADWFSIQGGARREPRAPVLMSFVPLSFEESQIALDLNLLEDYVDEEPGPLDLIPVADLLADGVLLVVDNRPGPDRGSIKMFDWHDANCLYEPSHEWPSLDACLRATLDALTSGGPSDYSGFSATVDAGVLDWVPPVRRYV
jgi:hypothetical protein